MKISRMAFIGAVLSTPLLLVGCGGDVENEPIQKSEHAPTQDQMKAMEENMRNMMKKKK